MFMSALITMSCNDRLQPHKTSCLPLRCRLAPYSKAGYDCQTIMISQYKLAEHSYSGVDSVMGTKATEMYQNGHLPV
jgi:hypothetical protein